MDKHIGEYIASQSEEIEILKDGVGKIKDANASLIRQRDAWEAKCEEAQSTIASLKKCRKINEEYRAFIRDLKDVVRDLFEDELS